MTKKAEADALLEMLRSAPTSQELLASANALAADLYWNEKDADTCHQILQVAAEAASRSASDRNCDVEYGDTGDQYRKILYNLASYGWLGWAEPSIVLSPAFQAAALEGARVHFALLNEINASALQRSRAHWILGALLIQSGEVETARVHFLAAAQLANEAEKRGEGMNADAFVLVCDVLLGVPGAEDALNRQVKRMETEKCAEELAGQAPTALRMFRHRGR